MSEKLRPVTDSRTKSDIRSFIGTLPTDETSREYEKMIVVFVMKNRNVDIDSCLHELLDDDNDSVAFAAFCMLCEKLRRNMNHSAHKRILDEYAGRFCSHPFFNHARLLYYVDNYDYSMQDEIIELARKNVTDMPQNTGALHAFSDIVAKAFEYAWTYHCTSPQPNILDEGITAVDQAIYGDPDYAKYYCTKGRLLSFKNQYDEALSMVQKAIDFEDSEKSDYSIRISRYIYYQQQIQTRAQNLLTEEHVNNYLNQKLEEYTQDIEKRQGQLKSETEESAEKLRSSMIKSIEFVALFSGIVSFTIGSISIASNLAVISFAGAAGLIIVLMGALLCVFSGFGVILHGFQKGTRSRNIVVFISGLILSVIGLLVCCALPKMI